LELRNDLTGPTEIHLVKSGVKPSPEVVFVHGLGGNWRTTWMSDPENDDTYWPIWLGDTIPQINVWSAQYPASPSLWMGRSLDLLTNAISLLDRLTQKPLTHPIVFVCHSLGGLVVKQLLRAASDLTATDDFIRIGESTVGIAFLGTPHTGSNIADTIKRVTTLLGGLGEVGLGGLLRLSTIYKSKIPILRI
jgi:pimeloyl-ACP methyl ester carboxylesterase